MSETRTSTADARTALWVFLFGNFVIGSGVLLPAGLLNPISADLGVSASVAGQLMLVGGIVVALGAPIMAATTSAITRRHLLTFSLLLYAVGHLAATLVTDFTVLLVLRGITMIAAAIFTPQAAATVGLLVPPEKRAAAIAFIFIGWSAASVGGIPLASYFATLVGWRTVFMGMSGLCAIAALLVWFSVRPGLLVQPLNVAAWKQALFSPVILCILLVTTLSMSGQMTVFTYIAPILRDAFSSGPLVISAAFAMAGVAGVLGNTIASRVVGRHGIDRVIAVTLVFLFAGFGIFAAGFGILAFAMAGIALQGLGSYSSNSLQQSRLVAVAPPVASATIALNTSAVYVGQAIGAVLGGWYMAQNAVPSPAIAWTGAGLTFLALIVSLFATRLSRSK